MSRRRSRHRRRRGSGAVWAVGAVLAVSLGLGAWAVVEAQPVGAVPACASEQAHRDGEIAGYEGEQLDHAVAIMRAGARAGFGPPGQRLGVMAAMGESGLRNIDYGDWETSGVRNPDGSRTTSIGLFQQQEWWGSVDERMDPDRAASMFFAKLATVDDWEQLEPSRAIHAVQVNRDPDHYTRWVDASTEVAAALARGCLAERPA